MKTKPKVHLNGRPASPNMPPHKKLYKDPTFSYHDLVDKHQQAQRKKDRVAKT